MSQTTDFLLELLRKPDAFPLFITGAGISLASGIATFRGTDPNAVWENEVLEKGTNAYFQKDPVGSWQFYLARFDKSRHAEPNPGHLAITKMESKLLESGRRCMTITQNVDGLHVKAGTQDVIEVHGSARKMRCARPGCENGAPDGYLDWDDTVFQPFRENPSMQTLPRCGICNKPIRAHVLWFDEGYTGHNDYSIERMFDAFDTEAVSLAVFVGTSFAVGLTAMVIQQAYSLGIPMFTVDPNGTTPDPDILPIAARAEVFLPALAEVM